MEAFVMTAPYTNWDEIPLVLSTKQVADLLGVHENTVKKLVYEGKLKAIKVGRILRFNRSEVKRYLGLASGEGE